MILRGCLCSLLETKRIGEWQIDFCASEVAVAMSDLAGLLASAEKSLRDISAEISDLGKKVDNAWQAYQQAGIWKRTDARDHWSATVRDREAARREKEGLLAKQKALIEKLSTEGTSAAQSSSKEQNTTFPGSSDAYLSHVTFTLRLAGLPTSNYRVTCFLWASSCLNQAKFCSCFAPLAQNRFHCHPQVRWQQISRYLFAGTSVKLNASTIDLIEDSSLFVCGRTNDSNDSLPSQCGFFVSPTGIITTAHGLPSNARKGTEITAYIRRAPGLDS